MKTTAAVALITGLIATTGAVAQSPHKGIDLVRQYRSGMLFVQGWVLGNVRAYRNAARTGAFRICVPRETHDGVVARAVIASIENSAQRGTRQAHWDADVAILDAMSDLYPCRN